jgi:hypothetical protein
VYPGRCEHGELVIGEYCLATVGLPVLATRQDVTKALEAADIRTGTPEGRLTNQPCDEARGDGGSPVLHRRASTRSGRPRDRGPVALNEVLYAAAARPLADLVVDERLDKFEGRLQFDETRLFAARSAAFVIADLPAEHVSRQVARIAGALDLDTAEVTAYVAEAVTRIADARWAAPRRATKPPPASPVPCRAEFPTPVTSAAITYPTTSRPTGAQHATPAVSASARSHHAATA